MSVKSDATATPTNFERETHSVKNIPWALFSGACLLILLLCQNVSAHRAILEQILRVTQLIEATPDDAALFIKRGELHRVHEDWSHALEDYETAVTLDPSLNDRVDLFRGILYFQSGQDVEAQKALDRFLSHNPHHIDGLITRARVLVRLGEATRAVEDYDDALSRSDRPKPGHYIERAQTVASFGPAHREQALLGLEQGITRIGPIVTLLLSAIELEVAGENYESAVARLDQIISQAQRKESWLYRRGEILERAGRREDAARAYAEALRLIEDLPQSRRRSSKASELESRLHAKLETDRTVP